MGNEDQIVSPVYWIWRQAEPRPWWFWVIIGWLPGDKVSSTPHCIYLWTMYCATGGKTWHSLLAAHIWIIFLFTSQVIPSQSCKTINLSVWAMESWGWKVFYCLKTKKEKLQTGNTQNVHTGINKSSWLGDALRRCNIKVWFVSLNHIQTMNYLESR